MRGRPGSRLTLKFELQLILISIIIPAVCMQWNGEQSSYQIAVFDNPIKPSLTVTTRLDHFTVHPDTGDVYVGAVNHLYRLDRNLTKVEDRDVKPCNEETCLNYNKILALQGGRLITCGSWNEGACQSRRLVDLMEDGDDRPNIAAVGTRSTVGIVAPGPNNDQRMYVAASYTDEPLEYQDIPPISRRFLQAGLGFMYADDTDQIKFAPAYVATSFPINYVGVFIWKEFTYFVTNQGQSYGQSNPDISKIVRVCHTSTNLNSYTEILIECRRPDSSPIGLAQAAHVGPAGPHLSESLSLDDGDHVLYAVFADGANSALCVYKMSDIEAAFAQAVKLCVTRGPAYSPNYMQGAVCSGGQPGTFDPTPYLCDASFYYTYATGITPVVAMAAVELPGYKVSSIITSIDLNHTVAFIGTSTGQLFKVHIESGTYARLYEEVSLNGNNAVMGDTRISETGQQVFVLTEQELIKMRVENCSQYTTCETCIGTDAGMDGDPYCGWCTLERMCTRYKDCPMQNVSTRWLAYNEVQCIEITNVAPHNSLPISVTDQEVTLTVERLPDLLDGRNYSCEFGDLFSNVASTSGETLQCRTPPASYIPQIPQGEDHVTVTLSVSSSETGVKFVDKDFSFYECDTHKNCVDCVGSRWACNWCVLRQVCTHDNSTCTASEEIIVTGKNTRGTSMEGPDACPQIQQQNGEVLIANDIDRNITVNITNLPESLPTSYKCSLEIENSPQMVTANRNGPSVTCNLKKYTYAETVQELNVTLTLMWMDKQNKDHILNDRHGFTVTLYKCEVLRPDCSRCVSEETTRAELACVWCGSSCVVSDSQTCSVGDVVTPTNNRNCPDPRILEIYPQYGPIEGNTILTLTGTDIGRRFTDIVSVFIGDQPCEVIASDYMTGFSVNCLTPNKTLTGDKALDRLQVTIRGADSSAQLSPSDISFGYKDPSIGAFIPAVGPQSGGTRLVIFGQSLDAGRYIDVYIDDMQCHNTREDVSDDSITCVTSKADDLGEWMINVIFDGATRNSTMKYAYQTDPTVNSVNPSSSVIAGGRELEVNGTGFYIIQQPQIVVTVGDNQEEFIGNCSVTSDIIMICTSPMVNVPNISMSNDDVSVNVSTGFIMDGVTALLNWCAAGTACTPLEYFQNPEYLTFDNKEYGFENGIFEKDNDNMIIRGRRLDLAISNSEVTVYIGKAKCANISVGSESLSCTLPTQKPDAGDYRGENTSRGLPVVWVFHGTTLAFNIGYIQYPPQDYTVLLACVISVFVLMLGGMLIFVMYKMSKKAQKEVDKCLDEIDDVQNKLADDMKTAFAELQTDVTDLTRDLEGAGMPFVSHREFATKMLFIALETKPMTTDPENPEDHVELAMKKFSDALSNKTFLLTLLQTLDEQSNTKLPIRSKGAIASLLTVIMVVENKLAYLTDVLFSLMSKMVQDELDAERPKQLFRRTDSILEKLLSNWIALCLYDSLKDHTAYSLFLLYRAIKCHSEHGPMDVISGQAKFTLSDDKLLTEDIEFRELVLTVIVNDADGETKEVKVLDIDTISQVKEKILDAIHRNQPYSQRPSANEVDLEWRNGQAGRLVLRDIDHTSATLDGWKRTNTLRSYHVPNKSRVVLVPPHGNISSGHQAAVENIYLNLGFSGDQKTSVNEKQRSNRYTIIEVDANTDNAKIWHLVKVEDGDSDAAAARRKKRNAKKRLSIMPSRPKKRFREIYIPRLISTKGTIQTYINNMFDTILNPSNAPPAVKYLFDFFDSQAVRHDLQDTDAVRIWKGNSLSLRFWSNVIRRPDYIFDIRPSRSMEASLGVIAQAFHDAHDACDIKLGKDSDLSKLLFNKDLPRIQGLVQTYYDGITQKPRVTLQELNQEMATTCQNFTGLFSKLSTLLQLWDYIKDFNPKIVEALEDDDTANNEHLPYKLVEIETTLSNQDCDAEEQV